METKKCKHCSEEKPLTAFARNPGMRDGYLNHCKLCRKARAKPHKRRTITPEQRKRWRESNPTKHRAHRIVEHAIRNYGFPRKPCELCGEPNAQAHHDDYSKPLDVRWLCFKHHRELHISLMESA